MKKNTALDNMDMKDFTSMKQLFQENPSDVSDFVDPLKIDAQLSKRTGDFLPGDYRNLNHGYTFMINKDKKLYQLVNTTNAVDEFDVNIKARQGHVKWVELVYDKDTKKHTIHETQFVNDDIIEYPDSTVNDIFDILCFIYNRFDMNDPDSKEFFRNVNGVKEHIEIVPHIEKYIGVSFSESLITDFKGNTTNYYKTIMQGLNKILCLKFII